MKRLFAFLLVLVMLLSMAACGGKQQSEAPSEEQSNSNQQAEETKAPETEAPVQTEASVEDWGVTDRSAARANGDSCTFYINFPYLTGIAKGYGLVAYQPDGSFVIVEAQVDDSIEAGSVDEVLPAYFANTITTLGLYRNAAYKDFAFEIDAQENVAINGYEMCKYEGTHTFTLDGVSMSLDFVAYAAQLNSNGAYVYWIVMDETADQSLGDTIADHAYHMALSLYEK